MAAPRSRHLGMKQLIAILLTAICSSLVCSQAQAQGTIELVNETNLPARKFSLYAVGYSTANKLMLNAEGKFVPIPAGSGKIPSHKIGGRGGLSRIILERSNAFAGGIVLVALVPQGRPAPYVTYTGGGASITQPTNPPGSVWPGNQGKYLFQFIEITQPPAKNPTIDISMVDGFIMPITATINPSKRRPNGIAQVGQPLKNARDPSSVNRKTIFQAYRQFIQREEISNPEKRAYMELFTETGSVDGQRTGIINPGLFIASGANKASLLNSVWNETIKTLFHTAGRKVGMRGDDNGYYRGTAMQVGGRWVLDFIGYTDPSCTTTNGNHYRVYSPLTRDPAGSYQLNESAGCMVFANDGVFADSSANAVISGPASVALGLQRDIVSAMNRGVALLGGTTGLNAENSTFWGRETNWYPKGETYNVFSRFMHTGQVGRQQISVLPRRPAKDAQKALMGQSYGFGFDESPVHSLPNQPNVPSKFDPTPDGSKTIVITFGDWAAG